MYAPGYSASRWFVEGRSRKLVLAATHLLVASILSLGSSVPCACGVDHVRRPAWTARVDELIEAKLSEQGLQPAGLCDDATFLRRATLDLTGRNPSTAEVIAFLRDADPQKRTALIDRLLTSPACAVHLANIWSSWLLPEMQAIGPPGGGNGGLHTWLRNRFSDNLRYDRLVADLLIASGSASSGPGSFFLSLEGKPEKIAAKTARVFMGVQLDCAECHDHPFDHWKQRDFWGFAAYFARLSADGMQGGPGASEVMDRPEGEVKLPNTEEVIAPKPLVATGLSGLESGSRRQQLTLWLTARENPYLARAAVNRCWSILFGRGLIEPIDDMRSIEIASHPELLRELTHEFASGGFDLRGLLRGLANTRAYQRASDLRVIGQPEDAAENSYAFMPVKPLTSTQLASCMLQVARDVTGDQARTQAAVLAQQLGKLRGDHSAATLGIVQALVTLHGNQLAKVHEQDQSRLLQALAAPHLNTQKRVEWLFISTLCRQPTRDEVDAVLHLSWVETKPAEVSSAGVSPGSDDSATETLEAEPVKNEPTKTETSESETSVGDNSRGAKSAAGRSSSDAATDQIPAWQADLLWALVNSTEFAMTP